ncbi:quinone-dependent dihydroorotate dehydrogenase [Jonesia denitrificans]|uniref:Dihydroorotate dehydrogenase (quinone) n=1 Tax=Jonesia denitrificans (strain ATCC 14870 / DSM 20603 / BCRC 15368 / CIP 55.134 / JCM 11481 / NBRC 15587 / NCTC 10816 / Prevot 55134) TaxID=471856 RepID=C7R4Q6_JONDD|nr:dihydroorotate dehydrogenase [Jonesia denitrificans DSM 20603]AVJ53351.1 quinone-dependent dihydroorotate dehydrogenase [Jonesia denitrificans]QXB44519.1 quinone-dependent dihydroorotate dehydrogenase [Jonesia denitrificans]SQH21310.1 Dihydroorotate dehydrogenase (quinone) [Jonesia denitrificans]
MYRFIFRHLFQKMDPEVAHTLVHRGITIAGRIPVISHGVQRALAGYLTDPTLESRRVSFAGRSVPAPFGLAGGFDKDARAVLGLTMLGFGFVEIGTVTAVAQPGNDKPRVWRELDDQALRNRMGFNNVGAAQVARILSRLRSTRRGRAVFLGVNIGKSKVTPAQEAPADYATSAALLAPYADYLVVNVSSPNTPGLRDLQAVESLRPILQATKDAAQRAREAHGLPSVPLLVKIAPDLADDDVIRVARLASELDLAGVVAVNTTINHDRGPGGLSGPPERQRGVEVVRMLRTELGEGPMIMGVGGISTPADAHAYFDAGATLVQGYTGFVYHGPLWAARMNKALLGTR